MTSSGLAEASWGKKGDNQSQAEAERQQILREMKKKTQLLTDNSWIRQRSTSTTTSKELIDLAGPIRRYASWGTAIPLLACEVWVGLREPCVPKINCSKMLGWQRYLKFGAQISSDILVCEC